MASALRSRRLQPKERQAILTEFLKQQYLYRQNVVIRHGLNDAGGMTELEVDEPAVPEESADAPALTQAVAALECLATDHEHTTRDVDEHERQRYGTVTAPDVEDTSLASTAGVPPQSPSEPATPSSKPVSKAGWASGAVAAAALIAGGTGLTTFVDWWNTPTAVTKPAVVSPQNPNEVQPVTSDMSSNLLQELENHGYSAAPTDLGADILRAFELNPALRQQLLENVQRTLEEASARPVPSPGEP